MIKEFKKLAIWKVFIDKNKNGFPLEKHTEYAITLMDQYYRAFPKYTLHNQEHLKNILRLIGELLGDNCEKLSDLECAIIILTVCFHDIGMVFSDGELKSISKEADFQKFLDNDYHAKWLYAKNENTINLELAEWYCRSQHAKRVWLFLNGLDEDKWDGVSLKQQIGVICESHNQDVVSLFSAGFEPEFLGEADLRFCAILLRLGDILDFDSSRSPHSVYEFLELDHPKNRLEDVSHMEWNKHLNSKGFQIKHEAGECRLLFIAGPDHPQIEKNIRSFLDIVDRELMGCKKILPVCSKKWNSFILPEKVDRTNIKPTNYKSGNYHLALDENKIIKLLTGENLYEHDFVFIRELLQNAIDTSRMRDLHERSNGNMEFKISPIQISCWLDADGYRWVRVDDYGMGINDYIISNHLLKKGDSVYSSDYFYIQREKFKEKLKTEFRPISRFGIGLLSCFLLGDQLEINTKSIPIPETGSEEESSRLSIAGLQGEYMLQSKKENNRPALMPSKYRAENDFRKEYGTSIALRIDRKKDHMDFEMHLEYFINQYLSCSPVAVEYNGGKVGKDFNSVMNTQLVQEEYLPFDETQIKKIEDLLSQAITSGIGIKVVPVDMTTDSLDQKLKGQLGFIYLHFPDEDTLRRSGDFSYSFQVDRLNEGKSLRFNKKYPRPGQEPEERSIDIDINALYNRVTQRVKDIGFFDGKDLTGRIFRPLHNYILIIHNGINIPNRKENSFNFRESQKIGFSEDLFSTRVRHDHIWNSFLYYGYIYLQDELIPDLEVSRSAIKNLGFNIYSSLYRAADKINGLVSNREYINNFFEWDRDGFKFEFIRQDKMIKEGYWNQEKMIETEKGILSIEDIYKELNSGPLKCWIPPARTFIYTLIRGLMQIFLVGEYIISKDADQGEYFEALSFRNDFSKVPIYLDHYMPLFILPFEDDKLIVYKEYINEKHGLIQWMIGNHGYLIENFQGYVFSLFRFIREKNLAGIHQVLEHFKKVLPDKMIPNLNPVTENAYPKEKQREPGF